MSSALRSSLYPQITPIDLRHLCNLWMVWLFAVVVVTAQTPAPATRSGTITGRVVNESGQPLANASVMLYPIGFMQQPHNGTVTDRDGKFQLSGLEARSYRVTAWLSSYAPFISPTIYRSGDSINVTLRKGGVITGTVASQTGEPIVGVRVHARMIRGDIQLAVPFSMVPLERTTDDRGVYRLYGLRAGTYLVWAGGGGGGYSSDIDAFDEFVPTYSPASTRDTATEITVHAGEEVSNVDISFRGEPGHVISGKVTQSGGAQPFGFFLNLTAIGKNKADWTTPQPDDGRGFVFRGIDDGDYDLTAVTWSTDGLGGAMATRRIKISGTDVTGIQLTVAPLATVSGRIALEESNKSECPGKERPSFSEMLVSASRNESQSSNHNPLLDFVLKGPAAVDANGNVSVKNLPPGRYFFMPEFAAKYWYLQSITLPAVTPPAGAKPVDATRTWTTLKSGDRISGLTITLAQGAASLSGQVGDNVPPDLFLYLIPSEKERADDALRFFGVAIGADGKVALSSIPPGSYWVLVKSTAEGAPTAKLRMPDQKELRASLRREAEAAKTAIDLKPCQHLTNFPFKLN